MSVNKVILVGRLGQNPEMRFTPSGAAVANFSVATNENWTDKGGQKQERTEWHRIVAWGKQAELCNQYLSKGRQVYLEGRLQTRQWQDKDGQTKYSTEIHANVIQFLGGGASASNDQSQPASFNRGPSAAGPSGAPYRGGSGNAGSNSGSSAADFGISDPAMMSAPAGGPGPMSGGGPFDQQQQSFTEDDVPF